MGGMAIGASVAARYSDRWKNLVVAYAVVEGVIGIMALFFHNLFDVSTQIAYNSIFPLLGFPAAVSLFKWTLAASLILPQSILLGMTFPLMSAGIIRRFPQKPGSSLAMLYFTNSIGAATGVLASGYFLIYWAGLHGTILTAAAINIMLALAAWLLSFNAPEESGPIEVQVDESPRPAARLR